MRNQYKQKAYQLILDARVKLKHGEYIEHQDQIRIDTNKILVISMRAIGPILTQWWWGTKTRDHESGRTKALILCVDKYYN